MSLLHKYDFSSHLCDVCHLMCVCVWGGGKSVVTPAFSPLIDLVLRRKKNLGPVMRGRCYKVFGHYVNC